MREACGKALIALSALGLGTGAAAEWVVVTRNPANGATTSYDTTRVRRTGQVLEVWTRADGAGHKAVILDYYRRNGMSPSQTQMVEERFARRLTKWRIDCTAASARTLAIGDYDAAGEAFYSTEVPGQDGAIYPDSVVDAAAQRLCAKPRARK